MRSRVLGTMAVVVFASVAHADPITLPTVIIGITGGTVTINPQPLPGPPELGRGGGRLTGSGFELSGSGTASPDCNPACSPGQTFTLSSRVSLRSGTIVFQGQTLEFDAFVPPLGGGELILTSATLFRVPSPVPGTFSFSAPFRLDGSVTVPTFLSPPTPDDDPIPASQTFALTGSGRATGSFSFIEETGEDLFLLDALRFDFDAAAPIPEPGSMLLLAGGMAALRLRGKKP